MTDQKKTGSYGGGGSFAEFGEPCCGLYIWLAQIRAKHLNTIFGGKAQLCRVVPRASVDRAGGRVRLTGRPLVPISQSGAPKRQRAAPCGGVVLPAVPPAGGVPTPRDPTLRRNASAVPPAGRPACRPSRLPACPRRGSARGGMLATDVVNCSR